MGKRARNLTKTERAIIINRCLRREKHCAIADDFGINISTVTQTMQRHRQHRTFSDLPRSGRPKSLEKRAINRLKFAIRKYPKIHYADLPRESSLADLHPPPSMSTMYRNLKRLNLINYRTSQRPKLYDQHAKLRRSFARQWRNFNFSYRTIKFSDETSVHRNVGGDREWCFRYPKEKYSRKMVTEIPKLNGVCSIV